ncbi:MAG: LarC family nickel insertion protein [Burkholderiales bacterium]|nr:LarC family nickel insertion protein [Burkholderiales bacterium]
MSTLHIHLDAIGGVAGDMFLAAVVDAFPELEHTILAAQRAAGLPAEVNCRFLAHRDDILTGRRFEVDDPHEHAHRHAHAHDHHHHHDETPFARIRSNLERAPVDADVRARAIDMFTRLARVEGEVHGVPADEVRFHELGGWDSIADIVGAAAAISQLGATWSVSTLPLGRGRVKTAHGWIPVPSPATARLLAGYEFLDDGLEGERVTPTGAAIVSHLEAHQAMDRSRRRLRSTGCGFGTRTFPGTSNVLRLMAFDAAPAVAAAGGSDSVAVLAFEVDDQSPEDLAIGLDRLRERAGVLDILQMPALGKKGRISVHVQILAAPDAAEDVAQAVFLETSTLGVRRQLVERRVLSRDQVERRLDEHTVRVKLASRGGHVTAKVESDDLRNVTGGRAARERARRAAESEEANNG